jgi:serine/threonine-protein kinase
MSDTLRTADTTELDLSGRQLGDYRILRRLGRGGMADVYLAEQSSLRRQIALKVLKRELANDETYVRRFHLEAQAAAALVHANIVQIYEVGRVDGHHYIAQEYVQGQNLRELLTRRGPPELRQAVSILRQVAAALAKAADQGVVHRDIKPENIMLTKAGEVKVADFGLARVTANGDALNLTQVGITMGTPLYMSPEQVEGRPLDSRSDIYSLGVTCYHMLAGEPPFRGDTALAIAIQHVRSEPPRLEDVRSDLPTGLCRIVHKMMAKPPEQRYQHPREILRELRVLQLQAGESAEEGSAEGWAADELAALGEIAIAPTHELDGLMKTQTLLAANSRWLKYMVAGVLGALVLGGLAAYAMREPFLLGDQEASIPPKDTAKEQHHYALFVGGNNASAWKAVVDRFPTDSVWTPSARKNLAILYLQRDDFVGALPLFKQLAEMDRLNRQDRALGLAGQVVIYAIWEDDESMANSLVELIALIDGIRTPEERANILDVNMKIIVDKILRQKMEAFEESTAMATQQFLESIYLNAPPQRQQKDESSKEETGKARPRG